MDKSLPEQDAKGPRRSTRSKNSKSKVSQDTKNDPTDTTAAVAAIDSTKTKTEKKTSNEKKLTKSSLVENDSTKEQKMNNSDADTTIGLVTDAKEASTDKANKGSDTSSTKKKRTSSSNDAGTSAPKESKKRTKVEPQRITERDELTRLWDAEEAMKKNGSYTFRIMSWNVAGLRALVKKQPNALSEIANRHNIDVLCLQETKLQNDHVTDPKLKLKGHLLEEQGYDSHWSCSTAKKGYSGTAVFIKRREITTVGVEENISSKATAKKKQATLGSFFDASNKKTDSKDPYDTKLVNGSGDATVNGDNHLTNLIPLQVSSSMGKEEHDMEGRIITMDFPLFTLANVYVPNSGQNLERLSYRTKQWDKDLLSFMKQKEEERGLPVIWLGDLNVAHKAYDCWNDGAKHLEKQAGTTKEEKESFQMQLDTAEGAYIDAFRHLYPDAKGHYTYWSQRAGNRAPNKGLRLDYFICSNSLFEDTKDAKVLVRDSYMIPEQEGSDHCPIVLELEIRK
eukprot:CAMPEP_0176499358 /NCGR_PEP_ID=MMETSP0200_2-20121128/12883_1 /TAXON_ID=947934 /ORGANISM="Chaetoceros sp., Strain GSL56" /LENGTH=508 /DNA_ID=CAMNT_0017897769 /DNA_START=241 /DNA_END=1767 /DNA_ORIENTATION=+